MAVTGRWGHSVTKRVYGRIWRLTGAAMEEQIGEEGSAMGGLGTVG